jgi:hypothetical protein
LRRNRLIKSYLEMMMVMMVMMMMMMVINNEMYEQITCSIRNTGEYLD